MLAPWKESCDKPSQLVSSAAQSRPTLCDPMNRSMPGLPVHHQLPRQHIRKQIHHVVDKGPYSQGIVVSDVSSVQFSCSVISDSLQPQGLQHTRLSCLSPTPGACSNSSPQSWRYHSTISSSVVPFSSCLQSFPAQGLFQSVSSLHRVAKILELQLQHQS